MKIYINNVFKSKNKQEEKVKKINKSKKQNTSCFEEKEIVNNENVVDEINNIDNIKKVYKRKGAQSKGLNLKLKENLNIKSKNILDNKCNSENNQNIKKQNLPKSYYALLILMIGLAGVSIKLIKDTNEEYTIEENYAVFNSKDDDSLVDESSVNYNLQNQETSNIDTREQIEEVSSVNSNNVLNKVQEKVNTVVEKKEDYIIFVKPHNGEISKIYSSDKVIYSKTLEMWKTHDGIDIKGKVGDIVYSAEIGTVEKVYEDAFYGITIVINHGQGYKTSYSNLTEETFVKEGDKVKKSQKIGKIGATSIGEIKDDPHIHFMLYKNNVVADPTSIF